jgi:uncharacterized protein
MRVLITGASGLIGTALVTRLQRDGVAVRRLVRRLPRQGSDDVPWNPHAQTMDPRALDDVDAVVHLAGEKIDQRWTTRVKHALRESRVSGTTLLARAIAERTDRPRVLVSGSAIGVYGSRGDEPLSDVSAVGNDFLAEICQVWERSAQPARDAGVRVVHPRTGIVLAKHGGALGRMLLPFKLGIGGRLGSGQQWMSWISLTDMVEAIIFAITNETLSGPANFVGPRPVRNIEFTKTLGRVLHRPTLIPIPTFALAILFGREMVEGTLLASQRAEPSKLLASGFNFRDETLEAALQNELRAPRDQR